MKKLLATLLCVLLLVGLVPSAAFADNTVESAMANLYTKTLSDLADAYGLLAGAVATKNAVEGFDALLKFFGIDSVNLELTAAKLGAEDAFDYINNEMPNAHGDKNSQKWKDKYNALKAYSAKLGYSDEEFETLLNSFNRSLKSTSNQMLNDISYDSSDDYAAFKLSAAKLGPILGLLSRLDYDTFGKMFTTWLYSVYDGPIADLVVGKIEGEYDAMTDAVLNDAAQAEADALASANSAFNDVLSSIQFP